MHFQHSLFLRTLLIPHSVGRDNVRDLIRPSIYHWLGDWIGIRGELIGCHGTNGALRWLPTASLAEISLFVESGKESYLNRKVGLVHSHLSLIIDDLASCSSKHPAYQFIILGARSFLSTLFFLCYSRNDVPKEIKVTRSQLWFFFPYRTFPQEISGSGSAPTTHQICLLFCSALYIFSSYEKEWIWMPFCISKKKRMKNIFTYYLISNQSIWTAQWTIKKEQRSKSICVTNSKPIFFGVCFQLNML
jgi:hypothetical protein